MIVPVTLQNELHIQFSARSENEALARMLVAAFIMPLDPLIDELNDVKTAVSEAVTNAILHGYDQKEQYHVHMELMLHDRELRIIVRDFGRGISDVEQARTPLYSTKPEWERAGMGFTIMEHFMDDVHVISFPGKGTSVELLKKLGGRVQRRWN